MSHSTSPASPSGSRMAWASGISVFAGVILISGGVFQAAQGMAAAHNDKIYGAVDDYLFKTDLSAWGWVHIVVGAVMVLVGASILAGKKWAIAVGIGVAALSALSNFLFLPHYPLWALVLIAFDVAVIWALSTEFER
ncbi:MAG TPA: hypothetical protein PLP61_11565 [Nocardioides sp.]|uniref:DUF7144 family membrane protein n=1 Tax=Nocardioides sp. TaxID=35761 RepID=UPI002D1C3707|nr:hypothetical protein [Nocardioides sp.]HQR27667.1 hypothetical protein [Nocardioides sp.]